MIEKVKIALIEVFGLDVIEDTQLEGLQPALYIAKDQMENVCFYLRDSEPFYFDFLSNVTAVDDSENGKFIVVYHLASLPYQTQLTLKVKVDMPEAEDVLPEVNSVSKVWKTAEWHEREAYDLMGIFFVNHPDLRRILMPDDWEGFPLRKNYTDPDYYHEIPVK